MSFANGGRKAGSYGISSSVTTTGIYTGVFTDAINARGVLHQQLRWAAYPSGRGGHRLYGNLGVRWPATAQPGGSYTLGTVQITVVVGDTINPFMTTLDGFVTASFSTVRPTRSPV